MADRSADGIICINMIHISPWKAPLGLMRRGAAILPPGSLLYLYGPYLREGIVAHSTRAYAIEIRTGVCRELDVILATAPIRWILASELPPMPANNLSVVFRRSPDLSRCSDRPPNGRFRNSHRARDSSLEHVTAARQR